MKHLRQMTFGRCCAELARKRAGSRPWHATWDAQPHMSTCFCRVEGRRARKFWLLSGCARKLVLSLTGMGNMLRKRVPGERRKLSGPFERNCFGQTPERVAIISTSTRSGNMRFCRPGLVPIEHGSPKLRAAQRQPGNHPQSAKKHIRGGGPRPELSRLGRSHIQRETTALTPIACPRRCTDAGRLAHDTSGW